MNYLRGLRRFRPSAPRTRLDPGFSLIVTVTILILLALVAVGVLTLSTVTIRSANLSSAQAEARANARLALMIAIGELQKHAGADQRITAHAGILDSSPETPETDGVNHPHWLGAWDSWAAGSVTHGNDDQSGHNTIRRPTDRQVGMNPSYVDNREDHFRAWLVSLKSDDIDQIATARNLSLNGVELPGRNANGVQLVGTGTLGDEPGDPAFPDGPGEENHVAAALLDVDTDGRPNTDRNGRYAWWISDESTKARILSDRYQEEGTLSKSGMIDRYQSAGSTGHQAIGVLGSLTDQEELKRTFSRGTLELLGDKDPLVRGAFHATTPFSYGIMADVREGGLKRDLNSLLERPINLRDSRDNWMLYRFGRNDERVPIQDLAAYYQCYREVVAWNGRQARNRFAGRSMQVNNIDFREGYNFLRDYTNIYRMPFAVKYQFLMSYIGVPRDQNRIKAPNLDTHKLHIGVTPAVTFWNPYNVPLVLNVGEDQSTQMRLFNIPFGIQWRKSGTGFFQSPQPNSLVWLTNRNMEGRGVSADNQVGGGSDRDNGITLYLGGVRNHVVFQPGEVRTFSLRQLGSRTGYEGILNSNRYRPELESDPGWDPSFFLELPRSERSNDARNVEREFPNSTDGRMRNGGSLTFKPSDRIALTIYPAGTLDMANGAAFHLFHRQSSTMYGGLNRGADRSHMRRQYQLTSRLHTEQQKANDNGFNQELMERGLPPGSKSITLPPVSGNEIIGRHKPFMLVSLTAGCEISQDTAGDFRGRRFVSRPFLHSSPAQTCAWIDRNDYDSFYHHGWNWWVQDVNSVLEAAVQVAPNDRSGYWGGGYTPEFGSTNIVQREVPLTPIHSIAALSHAQLSGYSLTNEILGTGAGGRVNNFEGTTATGGNGLFPRTDQAIGNSYAHPYLRADQAYGQWTHHYNVTEGPETKPFVDHSYLANKALWDDYFFSSIAPRQTQMFEDADSGTARDVATRFFFENERLPNRRFIPYLNGLTEEQLGDYFDGRTASLEAVDEIASYMMVEGPFNVNSTSVSAWKALFSSLRDREVPTIPTSDNSNRLGRGNPVEGEDATGGVPIANATVGNGEPYTGSSSNPSDPDQWFCWRSLTDEEIDELAVTMVEQVKRRGPFLSLSEFVNRRLDSSKPQLSVKGALQSAIDDEDCTINEGFRNPDRRFSAKELGSMKPKFPEALEGPIAYGSAAYVDQADILRSYGGQLTPRGDTFLIRTYGDSLDAAGNVRARAWCEAVVQRVPEYLDQTRDDKPHTKFDDLDSEANRTFGRPLRVVSFRWLDSDEV